MSHEFRICDSGDWVTWILGFFLFYPYMVWATFFVLGFMMKSPILMFISKVANPITWLFGWGISDLLQIKRPAGQDCDLSFAVPDRGMLVAIVTMYTAVSIIICTRRNVSFSSILIVLLFTLLYLIAINTNGYLTPIQFFLSLGCSLTIASFWVCVYLMFVRPSSRIYKWSDTLLIGIDRMFANGDPATYVH